MLSFTRVNAWHHKVIVLFEIAKNVSCTDVPCSWSRPAAKADEDVQSKKRHNTDIVILSNIIVNKYCICITSVIIEFHFRTKSANNTKYIQI